MDRNILFALAAFSLIAGLSACSPDEPATDPVAGPVASTPAAPEQASATDPLAPTNPFARSSGSRPTTGAQGNDSHVHRGDSDPGSETQSETVASRTPAVAEEQAPVTISASAVGLTVEPTEVNYQSMQVSLSGPDGLRVEKNFKPGEATQIDHSLPDGLYKWRAVTQPSVPQWVRDQMRAVRESGDYNAERKLLAELRSQGVLPTEEQARNNVHSGTIRIHNGVMVTPGDGETRQDNAG
jgi:hypothetical protein